MSISDSTSELFVAKKISNSSKFKIQNISYDVDISADQIMAIDPKYMFKLVGTLRDTHNRKYENVCFYVCDFKKGIDSITSWLNIIDHNNYDSELEPSHCKYNKIYNPYSESMKTYINFLQKKGFRYFLLNPFYLRQSDMDLYFNFENEFKKVYYDVERSYNKLNSKYTRVNCWGLEYTTVVYPSEYKESNNTISLYIDNLISE